MAAAATDGSPVAPGPNEDEVCLVKLEKADQSAREAALAEARAMTRAEQQAQYKEAVGQLNEMLAKAEQFNATCERLASESSFLCKERPAGFTGGELRDYQQAGVEWLSTKHFLSESGIIADEMGLGKTVQIVAYTSWMRADPVRDGPVLVVVPLSTLRNWVNEFRRFAPSIPVVEYHGSQEERAELRREHIPGCPAWAQEPMGKARARAVAAAARRRGVARMTREQRCEMPVFVTTYSIAMNDSAVMGKAVVPWGLLVVDESHRLKNSASRLTAELESYCWREGLSGTQKVILTGTPLQNDLTELWSLCHFVMPLIFADKEAFRSVYGFLQLDTAEGRSDVLHRQERDHIISTLHRLLARYMLRRTKADVRLELPPKVEVVVYCGMTAEQERIAAALVSGSLAAEVEAMGWYMTPGDSAVGRLVRGAGRRSGSGAVSNLHMHLRKVANHPFLFAEPHPPPEEEEDEAVARLEGIVRRARARAAKPALRVTEAERRELEAAGSSSDDDGPAGGSQDGSDSDSDHEADASARRRSGGGAVAPRRTRRQSRGSAAGESSPPRRPPAGAAVRGRVSETTTDETIVTSCAKMAVLDTMLRRLKREGHKVLVFSQFARTLEVLSDYLEMRRPVLGAFEHLDGSTPREERQASMDRFNEDDGTFAFLLSTRAGGLGINLTGADTVIIYDSDWNPHADSQAEDRAHRIGQTRPVVVYRLVTAGSVEQGLVQRANSKRALERVVLQDGRWLRGDRPGAAGRAGKRARGRDDAAGEADGEEDGEPAGTPLTEAAEPSPPKRARGRAQGAAAGTAADPRHAIERTDLRRWLRDDLTGAGTAEAIGPEELDAVLDRPAVMGAGAAVLARIEGTDVAERLGFSAEQLRRAAEQAAMGPSAPAAASAARGALPPRGRGYEVTYHSVSALRNLAAFAGDDAGPGAEEAAAAKPAAKASPKPAAKAAAKAKAAAETPPKRSRARTRRR